MKVISTGGAPVDNRDVGILGDPHQPKLQTLIITVLLGIQSSLFTGLAI